MILCCPFFMISFFRRGSGLARYGGVGGPKNLTPNLRRSKSHVVKKLSDNINTDEKQLRLKTSTSCPNVGNQTKKPVARKSTLKLKPKNNSESNQQMIKVSCIKLLLTCIGAVYHNKM